MHTARNKSKTKQLHYYLVQAKNVDGYDRMRGCVVKCHSIKRARQLAQENGLDETHHGSSTRYNERRVQYWTRSDKATCRRLTHNENDAEETILMDVG
jgi:hypothetical protein